MCFFFFFAILHLLNSLRTFFGELAGVSHPQHLAICFFWGGTLKFSPEWKFQHANVCPSVCSRLLARWWFQICFIFTPIWGRFPFWLIFFKWVETTNQLYSCLPFFFLGVLGGGASPVVDLGLKSFKRSRSVFWPHRSSRGTLDIESYLVVRMGVSEPPQDGAP